MDSVPLAPRLRHLPVARVLGREVRVAEGFRARLLGLAFLGREGAGPGLLIPRCSSVHTFGMRFPLDLFFLDESGAVVATYRRVAPRCLLWRGGAAAVLEMPGRDTAAGTGALAGSASTSSLRRRRCRRRDRTEIGERANPWEIG